MPFSIINTITSWFLKKRIHQIELFKKYPIEVQNEVLMSLIKNAENTEYAQYRTEQFGLRFLCY